MNYQICRKSPMLSGLLLTSLFYHVSAQSVDPSSASRTIAGKLIQPRTPPLNSTYVMPDTPKYDYSELLHKSFLFYHSQISGKLETRRLAWRGDSCFDCKGTYGEDLTKAWYEAANTMKWGLPLGFSATQLNWNIAEYADSLEWVNQFNEALFWVRQGADYFLNVYTKSGDEERIVGVFGTSEISGVDIDFGYFGPPEEYEMWAPNKQPRVGYYCVGSPTINKGCSEVAGAYAAALASASVIFSKIDPAYSTKCLEGAKVLYEFGNKYKGTFNNYSDIGFVNMRKWYPSSGYYDELALAAIWLHIATMPTVPSLPLKFGDPALRSQSSRYLQEAIQNFQDPKAMYFSEYSWDDCSAAAAVLLYKVTGDAIYATQLKRFYDIYTVSGPAPSGTTKMRRTPRGLLYQQLWGSLRYAANVAFISLVGADMIDDGARDAGFTPAFATELRTLATQQINYIVGDTDRSWIPGFGNNYPLAPYHKASYNSFIDFPLRGRPNGDSAGDFTEGTGLNRFILYGAVVGGPNLDDTYYDDRNAYEYTEVTQDYNAGYTGALAGLIRYYSKKAGSNETFKPFSDCNLDLGWNHPNATGKPVYPADDCYHTCNKCTKSFGATPTANTPNPSGSVNGKNTSAANLTKTSSVTALIASFIFFAVFWAH